MADSSARSTRLTLASARTDPYMPVREFLADAGIRPEFAARVLARIEAQDPELGSSFLWTSLGWLVTECAEEAEDLAAWSALISARLQQDAPDDPATARGRGLLAAAAQRAGEADTLLQELRRLVERPA